MKKLSFSLSQLFLYILFIMITMNLIGCNSYVSDVQQPPSSTSTYYFSNEQSSLIPITNEPVEASNNGQLSNALNKDYSMEDCLFILLENNHLNDESIAFIDETTSDEGDKIFCFKGKKAKYNMNATTGKLIVLTAITPIENAPDVEQEVLDKTADHYFELYALDYNQNNMHKTALFNAYSKQYAYQWRTIIDEVYTGHDITVIVNSDASLQMVKLDYYPDIYPDTRKINFSEAQILQQVQYKISNELGEYNFSQMDLKTCDLSVYKNDPNIIIWTIEYSSNGHSFFTRIDAATGQAIYEYIS